jgi:hypothetical protein
MLKIREQQIEALEEYMRQSFIERTIKQLRGGCPDLTADRSDENLRKTIEAGIERAKRYGITIEWDVCRYIEYQLRFGVNFDTSSRTAWAGDLLRSHGIDGTSKMDRIVYHYLYCLNQQ